jgi:putative transposase
MGPTVVDAAIAGDAPRASSGSTVARWPLNGRVSEPAIGPSWPYLGRRPKPEERLGRWAMNLMLTNVSTVRLPEGDIPIANGAGVSKSAVSRRFVALSAERMAEWMAADLSPLDLLAIQIDGIHISEELTLLAALGIDGDGVKHPLGLLEGATENAVVVQALLDNLIERGLNPKVCRLFIVDGAKALIKAIRKTFGGHTPIQCCQIHKARNIIERLPKPWHASVRKALRQAWERDDAEKAERLIRNLARRLEQVAPGVAASILERLDEMLTVIRLGLPLPLRRSLACTNIIENTMGTIRRIGRNVKRCRNASMALRWTAAAMQEPANTSSVPTPFEAIRSREPGVWLTVGVERSKQHNGLLCHRRFLACPDFDGAPTQSEPF